MNKASTGPQPLRWTLRPLRPEDFEWDFALLRDALGPYVEATWGWEELEQRQRFAERYPEALRQRQVIEVAGAAVGVLTVRRRVHELYLERLEITPAHQGRGLGGVVLSRLLARGSELDLPLTLHVLRANPRARALYERHGLGVVDDSDPIRVKLSSRAGRL
jgi:ribosomal protein S18 acetylase RimI-like enzyme